MELFARTVSFSPCQEGAYQLTITTDLKLKVCRLRPDYGLQSFKK